MGINQMSDDPLQNRISKREYLKTFLDKLSKAQEISPQIYKELDITNWEIDMLSNRPDEAAEIPDKEMREHFSIEMQYLHQALPMIPDYDARMISSSDGISTAGTAISYGYAAHVGDIRTPKAFEFSGHFTAQYQEIQKKYDRPKEIRNLLLRLPSRDNLTRFDSAKVSYIQYKAGIGKKTSAANEMRNFVNGLKGDLFQLVFKENENKSWHEMTKRLSKDDPSGYVFREILNQEKPHSDLLSGLADILKDREGGSLTDLDHIWTKILDHTYILLKLIGRDSND